MSKLSLIAPLAAASRLATPSTMAADDLRTEAVQFANGSSSKSITGSASGDRDLNNVGAAG